jgi:hypothetical protein
LLSGCTAVRSEDGRLATCPAVAEYGREFLARAAEEEYRGERELGENAQSFGPDVEVQKVEHCRPELKPAATNTIGPLRLDLSTRPDIIA